MEEIFLGRQPILDAKCEFYSYELLYRNSNKNSFPDVNPEIATIGVIVNTYLAPGFEQIARKRTFINFTSSLLATDIFETIDPDHVVIEILEDVEITASLLIKLKKLKSMGFQLALDDFILQKNEFNLKLFPIIDYIKVDFVSTTKSQRAAIEALKGMYPHIKLVAEKVETEEQFELAKLLGYELFQGYFFAKPDIIKKTKLPSDTLLYFEIIKMLNEEIPNIDEIAAIILRDVSLTFKLLKYLNTYAFKTSVKVTSIHQAIVRMGLQELKKWILFLAIYHSNGERPSGKDKALVDLSVSRANICELLAEKSRKHKADECYMLGMFSLVDVILNCEPTLIFPVLPVKEEIVQTLSGRQTEMTIYLEIAKALERFEYSTAIQLAGQLGINEQELSEMTLKATIQTRS